jgi:RNA polymerase subunit RPABC4/transcription elongation factor Spt4
MFANTLFAWFFVWGSPQFVITALLGFAIISTALWWFRRVDEDRAAVLATRPPRACRQCGEMVSQVAEHCPHCGVRAPTAWQVDHKTGLLIVTGVFGVPILLMVLWFAVFGVE